MAFGLFHASTFGAVLFPPAGITTAAMVILHRRYWPWVLCAIILAEAAIDVAEGLPSKLIIALLAANCVEPVVGALLFRRFGRFRDLRFSGQAVAKFVFFGVLGGPLFGASVYALVGWRLTGHSSLTRFVLFWSGDALGVLTVGGTVLVWAATIRRRTRHATRTAGVSIALTSATAALTFWPRAVPIAYLSLAVILGVALLVNEVVVVMLCGLAFALIANIMTAARRGPWAALAGRLRYEMVTLQLFLGVCVLGAWLLATEIDERRSAEKNAAIQRVDRDRFALLQALTARLATAATSREIAEVIRGDCFSLIAAHGVIGIVSDDRLGMWTWRTFALDDHLDQFLWIPLDSSTPLTFCVVECCSVEMLSRQEMLEKFPRAEPTLIETGVHSMLTVPVLAGGKAVAALAFGFGVEGEFSDDVKKYAAAMCDLVGSALVRARLYEDEQSAAHELQQGLLPTVAKSFEGLEAFVLYRPAVRERDIGGDWYDVFTLPNGRIAIAVGDVVGHDIHAATVMARLQTAVRVVAPQSKGPSDMLGQLDRASMFIPGSEYTTIAYAEYDPVDRTLRYACAGHLPPLFAARNDAHFLPDGRSEPLGPCAPAQRPEATISVTAGERILLYTDGLIERRREPLDISLHRLAELAKSLYTTDPEAWCLHALDALDHESRSNDDIAIVCVTIA